MLVPGSGSEQQWLSLQMASAFKGYSAKRSRISVGGSRAAHGYGTRTHNLYACWKLFKHRWKGKSDLATSWLTTHDSELTHGKQYLLWASFICFVEMKYWTHLKSLGSPADGSALSPNGESWSFGILCCCFLIHSHVVSKVTRVLCICRVVGKGVLYYPLEACCLKATLCSRLACSDVKLVPCVNGSLVLSPPPQDTVM